MFADENQGQTIEICFWRNSQFL